MPNRKTHKIVGSIVGGGAAAWSAREERPVALLFETLGGIGGGIIGARMPDIIDPPTSGRHRSVGHGVVPVGAAATAFLRMLTNWQAGLRSRAEEEHHQHGEASSILARAWHMLLSALYRMASGALAGFLAGYLSHLAMDFTTPAGLPIFA